MKTRDESEPELKLWVNREEDVSLVISNRISVSHIDTPKHAKTHTPATLIKKMGDLPWQRSLVSAASHVHAAGCRHKESL